MCNVDFWATTVWADTQLGPITFTLTPGGGIDNHMSPTFTLTSPPLGSDTQTTYASGTFTADLWATFNPLTHAATATGIGYVQGAVPGNVSSSPDMTFFQSYRV